MSIAQFRKNSRLKINTSPLNLPVVPLSAGIEEIEKIKTVLVEKIKNSDVKKIIFENSKSQFSIKPIVLQNNILR